MDILTVQGAARVKCSMFSSKLTLDQTRTVRDVTSLRSGALGEMTKARISHLYWDNGEMQ